MAINVKGFVFDAYDPTYQGKRFGILEGLDASDFSLDVNIVELAIHICTTVCTVL